MGTVINREWREGAGRLLMSSGDTTVTLERVPDPPERRAIGTIGSAPTRLRQYPCPEAKPSCVSVLFVPSVFGIDEELSWQTYDTWSRHVW